MRLYHFLNAEFALDDIAKRRLKVALIEDLNDPFEMFAATLSDEVNRGAFHITRKSLSAQFGFLCFSESWTNPVQWSHYADRHRGVCLGFDIPERLTAKIHYERNRIPLTAETIYNRMNDEAFKIRAATTKFSHWRYERERRCILQLDQTVIENGLNFVSFSDDLILREVIVGLRCQLSRADISSALADLAVGIDAFQVRLAFRSFRMVRQRQSALWK